MHFLWMQKKCGSFFDAFGGTEERGSFDTEPSFQYVSVFVQTDLATASGECVCGSFNLESAVERLVECVEFCG